MSTNWRDHAACLSSPDLFLSEHPVDIRRARAICADCPVLTHCAAFAAANDVAGTVAGLTADERDPNYAPLAPIQRRCACGRPVNRAVMCGSCAIRAKHAPAVARLADDARDLIAAGATPQTVCWELKAGQPSTFAARLRRYGHHDIADVIANWNTHQTQAA